MAFSYKDYVESNEVSNARNQLNQHTSNKVSDWTGGTYGQNVQDTMNKINNREKFTYDVNGDALYQQYKDKYMTQGKLAMADTIGQASALTGGYGNSYATTAGFQAYQGYLQNLNDVVPQLYQLAMEKYQMEGDDLNNKLNMYQNAYNTEYGEYRDKVSDWNTEANRLQNAYDSAYNQDYGRYSDDYNRAFANYQQSVSESQFAQSLAVQKAQLAASQNSGITATQSSRTKELESNIMTTTEFARHNNKVNGTSYKTYSDYVKAVIDKWNNDSRWTDGELEYLRNQYSLK